MVIVHLVMITLLAYILWPIPKVIQHSRLISALMALTQRPGVKLRLQDATHFANIRRVKEIRYYINSWFPYVCALAFTLTGFTWFSLTFGEPSDFFLALFSLFTSAYVYWALTFHPYPRWMHAWKNTMLIISITYDLEVINRTIDEARQEILDYETLPELAQDPSKLFKMEESLNALIQLGQQNVDLLRRVENERY